MAYGAGLRAAEVVSLKVFDIDSRRMIIRVEQGKGGKDRNVIISPHLLDLLRTWWKAARPQGWLFPGRDPAQPMTTRQLNRDPKHLGARIGITSVLHTWGSAMTHRPHVHMIVPGGGISPDGQHWLWNTFHRSRSSRSTKSKHPA